MLSSVEEKRKAQLANLIPFKDGPDSRRSGGRPKGAKNITYYIDKALQKKIENTDPVTKKISKKPIKEWISYKLIALALDGDLPAIRELLDRTEGKLPIIKAETNIQNNTVIDGDVNVNLTAEQRTKIDAVLVSALEDASESEPGDMELEA